ncbi:hypothetical protein KBZ21_41910, partial [Streptomyces sp. A73]|nr:hypothetical protein [Streptomyces sp. A73]
GRSGIWGETALQLAAYARAEFYLDEHGIEQPIPHVDGGLAVWMLGLQQDEFSANDMRELLPDLAHGHLGAAFNALRASGV